MTTTAASPIADATIAQAAAAAHAAPTDAGTWLALISLLQQARRFDAEEQALRDAARHLPDHPHITLAAGISAFRHGKLDLAQRTLTRAAELEPASPAPWVALARVAEMKGNLALTLRHTLHAVQLDPRQAPVLVDVGRGLQSVGRVAEAERAFRGAVEAWRVLAAFLGEHGKTAEALQALDRALTLAPRSPDLHALAGDILRVGNYPEDAARAYANALEHNPKSAELLNKLGCIRKQLGDTANAEQMLQQAIALDPAFRFARENLVTLYIEQNKVAAARSLLHEALSVRGLADDARHDAGETLAILDEHERLAPIIAQAVAQGDDALLAEAIKPTPDVALALDDAKLAAFRDLAQKAGGPVRERENMRFARGLPSWVDWPLFEAHFALHRGDSLEAVLGSRALLHAAKADLYADQRAVTRKLQRYVRAIALRRALPPAGDTGAASEARLRFWHAAISPDSEEFFGGQIKPSLNYVSTNPLVLRTPPAAVAGTLRRLLSEHRERAPPGPWRAALLYFAIVDMHGFRDGNGRLARFLINVELEAAGYHPIVHSDGIVRSISAALSAVRHLDDLAPLVDLFAHASAETARLVATVQAHDKALH